MRRATVSTLCALVGQRRTSVVYSEMNQALVAGQAANNYTSNVWVEDWTLPSLERFNLGKLKDAQKPVTVTVPKIFELYNFSQLTKASVQGVPEAKQPSSFSTRKAYSGAILNTLMSLQKTHGYQSNWWVSRSQMTKDKRQALLQARPHQFVWRVSVNLFNASQFDRWESVSHVAVNGSTRRFFPQSTSEALLALTAQKGYPTGLFFTQGAMKRLQLTAATGAVPHDLQLSMATRMFNVEQLENCEAVMARLQRSPSNVHAYLVSGEAVQSSALLPAMDACSYSMRYWLTQSQLDSLNAKLKEGAKPLMAKSLTPLQVYNVAQLKTPAEGFKKAGTVAREAKKE